MSRFWEIVWTTFLIDLGLVLAIWIPAFVCNYQLSLPERLFVAVVGGFLVAHYYTTPQLKILFDETKDE